MRGFLRDLFEAFSNVDSKLLGTFRELLTRPGSLTVAYVEGRRIAFLGPVQVFLIANVLFFAVQSLTEARIFTSSLDSHLHLQDWQGLAGKLVDWRLRSLGVSLESYARAFDRAVVLNAKSLIIVMAVPLTLILPALFHSRRRPFVAHASFALHTCAFLLVLLCVVSLVGAVDALVGGAGLNSPLLDTSLAIVSLVVCALYLYRAIDTFYGSRGASGIVTAVLLTASIGAISMGYRFLVFVFTLYTTA